MTATGKTLMEKPNKTIRPGNRTQDLLLRRRACDLKTNEGDNCLTLFLFFLRVEILMDCLRLEDAEGSVRLNWLEHTSFPW